MNDKIVENFLNSLGIFENLKNITQRLIPILPPADRDKVLAMLDECRGDVYKAYIKTYGEIFTENELLELTAIHSAPVMQKFRERQEEVITRVDHYTKLIIMKYVAEQALKQPLPSIAPEPTSDPNKDLN